MYTTLTLTGSYHETTPQSRSPLSLLSPSGTFAFDRFYLRTARILADRRIKRVLVHATSRFSIGPTAGLQEIRARLVELAAAGKELVFHASEYSDLHLYLASACQVRVIHPLGAVRAVGFARTFLFFKRAADKNRVSVQISRRGRYKSAGDAFRVDSIDESNREQYQRWFNIAAEHVHSTILAGYAKPREELDLLLGGEVLDASVAVARGWCTHSAAKETLLDQWKRERMSRRKVKSPSHLGRGKRLAVLTFEGGIVEGKNRYDPLMRQSVGSESFVPHIDALAGDRRVKAVVFRVNSRGGSAVASEDVRSALERLSEKKPLVVSMANYAGSGGYWISMVGRKLFARDLTVTGSIGVITLTAALNEAIEAHGITHTTLRTHAHADAMGPYRTLDEAEFAALDEHTAAVYERFLDTVQSGRELPRAQIDACGQGRVWSGADAVQRRLVDSIGGLSEAIAEAKRLADLNRCRIDFYPKPRRSLPQRLLSRMLGGSQLGSISSVVSGDSARAIVGAAAGLLEGASVVGEWGNRPLLWSPELTDRRS